MNPHGDHPYSDPGDGRTECQTCGKWVFEAIHSCKGVPVTMAALARMTERKRLMSNPTAYILTRDVTVDECRWLETTIPSGTIVYRCIKPTYNCVREFAATSRPDGGYPFFELPHSAIEPVS